MYTCTEPFVADMLTLHENSFLSNPNAVYDAKDCRGQMAASALLQDAVALLRQAGTP